MNLQKYNQWILAIAGTVALVFLIGALLVSAFEYFSFRSYDYEEVYSEPLSEEGAKELLEDSLRSQIVSFSEMILIDSASKTYLLPVGQADLKAPEKSSLLELTNSYRSSLKMTIRFIIIL